MMELQDVKNTDDLEKWLVQGEGDFVGMLSNVVSAVWEHELRLRTLEKDIVAVASVAQNADAWASLLKPLA